MNISNTSFDEGLCLLGVLPFGYLMTFHSQADSALNQCLGDGVEIDKETSCICVDIERLIEVSAIVNFSDDSHDNGRNPVDLSLLAHKVDFVVQRLGNLENGVDQEAVVQFLRLGAE